MDEVHELEVVAEPMTPALFGTTDATQILAKAKDIAEQLTTLIQGQGLAVGIRGRSYVRVEGWTTLGAILGVFPVTAWTRKLEDGWEARVEAKTLAGQVVGAAEASCLRSEDSWKDRDEYALRSMAQTRATSKALRQPLGWVIVMSGFEATPAEEMIGTKGAFEETAVPSGYECPKCGSPVLDNVKAWTDSGGPSGERKGVPPRWKCSGPTKDCTGKRYGWGSWDPHEFEKAEMTVESPWHDSAWNALLDSGIDGAAAQELFLAALSKADVKKGAKANREQAEEIVRILSSTVGKEVSRRFDEIKPFVPEAPTEFIEETS